MGAPKKPSSNWLTNLQQVIEECEAETGTSFATYVDHFFQVVPLDPSDSVLVDKLKEIRDHPHG